MKIFVDAVSIRGAGSAVVLLNILNNISNNIGDIYWKVFISPKKQRSFDIIRNNPIIQYEEVNFDTTKLSKQLLWQQVVLPRLCQKEKADVIFCMGNTGAVKPSVPQVVYFHQALYLCDNSILRRWFATNEIVLLKIKRLLTVMGMKASDYIITQTDTIEEQVISKMKIDMNKVVSIHTGVPTFLPIKGHPTPGSKEITNCSFISKCQRPTIVYISHPAVYKNIEILIEGMHHLKKQLPGTLILTLSEPSDYPATYALLVQKYNNMVANLGLQDSVKFIGAIAPITIKELIQRTDIFVFSSLVESFPQILAEAMSCGAVMLLADKPYANEIVSDAAIYFDPESPETFASMVKKIWLDEVLQKKLSTLALKRSELFDYKLCTETIINVLRSCDKSNRNIFRNSISLDNNLKSRRTELLDLNVREN
jgi:glycosyltransferase involved in cell wall biosynthesis